MPIDWNAPIDAVARRQDREREEEMRALIEWRRKRLNLSPCGGYYCDEKVGHIDCSDAPAVPATEEESRG